MGRFRDQYAEDEQFEVFCVSIKGQTDQECHVSFCWRPPDQEEEGEEACYREL